MTMQSQTRQATSAVTGAPTGAARSIQGIYSAPRLHWVGDGFRVAGYFNVIPDAAKRLSPFLLLDYHPAYEYPPSEQPRGVGVHPHRGFETVTLAFDGKVAHHDSAGNGGIIGPGDVQWMTAASGILHKEYHEREFSRQGGTFHMAQLWVNLPKAHKMDPPRYQGIESNDIGVVTLDGDAGVVRIVAGTYQGVKGPAKTFSPVGVFEVRLNAGGVVPFHIPAHENVAVLVMDGDVLINEQQSATTHDFVLFDNVGDNITIEARSNARLLVLSGEPIDEPVVAHGPFVMNTKREIIEAINDFNRGAFGQLED